RPRAPPLALSATGAFREPRRPMGRGHPPEPPPTPEVDRAQSVLQGPADVAQLQDSAPLPTSTPSQHGFLRRHAGKLVASLIITCGIVVMVRKGGLKFL